MDRYEKLYVPQNARSITDVFDSRFLAAWEAEFGLSLNGSIGVVGALEEAGLEQSKPILEVPRSILLSMISAAGAISLEGARLALEIFALTSRPEWRVPPTGFENRDWQPWRFGRRLSVMRRPFLQLDQCSDPSMVIAPGLAREALYYVVTGYHSGEIAQWQARSGEMRSWLGHANHIQRSEFNSEVAERMREFGWNVMSEVNLTGILGRGLDRNYGDIDVLAWRRDSGRVLAIECKDLQYQKTIGEVAAQLADYRGELKQDGKPDDLRKHFDRIHVLRANPAVIDQKLNLLAPLQLEAHMVFRNPVPMKFAWEQMAARIRLSQFDELDQL
jgi:hypothetical protein